MPDKHIYLTMEIRVEGLRETKRKLANDPVLLLLGMCVGAHINTAQGFPRILVYFCTLHCRQGMKPAEMSINGWIKKMYTYIGNSVLF